MKCDKSSMLLYAVTDRAWSQNQRLCDQVELALKGGVTCLQLREKNLCDSEFLNEAKIIKTLCEKYKVPFIINDNVGVAIACKADGIHVGQHDMQMQDVRTLVGEKMILGVSVQTAQQAVEAEKQGADYLGVGAVFSTSTKLDADDVSHETLKQICESVNIPVVAIGGIHKHNIMDLKGTGIDGVALVSAIFANDDIMGECAELKLLSEAMVRS